ncbi:DUF47 domain-containing protein [Clostridium sp.]|jgi:uncharacterized protein|uniref:DUF47 domain-containing protein n=1 Tax=Clostridium sp. TaxID=1506 RepID=UPI0039F4CD71
MSNRKMHKLFSMLLNVSNNLKDGGEYFYDYKINEEKDLDVFRLKMKEFEYKGDELLDELIKELNNTFITPIEREDALELAAHMDDILNGFEECAARLYIYKIYKIDNYMLQFSDLLNKCVIEINNAVELLSQKRLLEIRQHAIKIREYEKRCDILERDTIKALFEREKDILRLIQYKEIYEILENIADDCQRVGKVLETVIMKNA